MWAKIGQWVLLSLVKPLIEKTVVAFFAWLNRAIKEHKRKKELKKKNTKKVEKYEESDSIDSALDDFGDLP